MSSFEKPAHTYKVIIPDDIIPKPNPTERSAAKILSKHFKADVLFIKRSDYHKTADIMIRGVRWEIKSPTGSGKRNIQHQFYRALKQSKNIIIDVRKSKLHEAKILREVKSQFMMSKTIKRLVMIDKKGKVIVFCR